MDPFPCIRPIGQGYHTTAFSSPSLTATQQTVSVRKPVGDDEVWRLTAGKWICNVSKRKPIPIDSKWPMVIVRPGTDTQELRAWEHRQAYTRLDKAETYVTEDEAVSFNA